MLLIISLILCTELEMIDFNFKFVSLFYIINKKNRDNYIGHYLLKIN